MNKSTKLVEIHYLTDEFCKEFYQVIGHISLNKTTAITKETENLNSIILKL